VLAFSNAQPKDGGTGATYVFLKDQKNSQNQPF
jgi:DNA-nicking Smr family endonuclease